LWGWWGITYTIEKLLADYSDGLRSMCGGSKLVSIWTKTKINCGESIHFLLDDIHWMIFDGKQRAGNGVNVWK
jgi:hypothetical protein